MIYIFSHLGLGDHIICNGIVRYYSEIYEKVFVFVRQHNFSNVSYMYRDNPNIIPIVAGDEFEVEDCHLQNSVFLCLFQMYSLLSYGCPLLCLCSHNRTSCTRRRKRREGLRRDIPCVHFRVAYRFAGGETPQGFAR